MTAAKVRLAMASIGRPGANVGDLSEELDITRQTMYRHVSPIGEMRPDGAKLLSTRWHEPHITGSALAAANHWHSDRSVPSPLSGSWRAKGTSATTPPGSVTMTRPWTPWRPGPAAV